jgi:hypothetical protein
MLDILPEVSVAIMLSNGTLCASVAAIEHKAYLSTTGGILIDLGYCGG